MSDPLSPEEAEGSQMFAEICGLGWENGGPVIPCPSPAAPVAVAGSVRSQGVVLQSTVPATMDGNAFAAIWEAWTIDASGNWHFLWKERSVQSVPAGGWPAGTTVRYGAPGLVANAAHRFRVAFEDADGKLTCWSNWSDEIWTTGFPAEGPSIPSGQYLKVWDDFDRPETDPYYGTPKGDGLGPDEVWRPSDEGNPVQAVRIAPSGTAAEVTPSSGFVYEAVQETDDSTFADVKARVNFAAGGTGFEYNLQVQARIGEPDPSTGEAPSYAVKLVKGARGCTKPTLMIFKLPSEYEVARCVEDENGNAVPDPAVVGVMCDEAPPLDVADPDDPNVSQPVWLRIMVENADTGDRVYVRGQAYWYDASGTLHTCVTQPLTRTDMDSEWLDRRGKWGASFHERYYLVDVFRAGDGTVTP